MSRSAAAVLLAVALFTSFSYPSSTSAAGKETQVRFAKGRSSASYNGALPVGTAEYDAYVLRARAGQTLTVSLDSEDEKAYLVVYSMDLGPGEDRITPEGAVRDWTGPLPVSGQYSVQVYTDGAGGDAYRVEIGVR